MGASDVAGRLSAGALDAMTARGKTVVAVTHDVGMAARMNRRIHLVDRLVSDEGRPAPARNGG